MENQSKLSQNYPENKWHKTCTFCSKILNKNIVLYSQSGQYALFLGKETPTFCLYSAHLIWTPVNTDLFWWPPQCPYWSTGFECMFMVIVIWLSRLCILMFFFSRSDALCHKQTGSSLQYLGFRGYLKYHIHMLQITL